MFYLAYLIWCHYLHCDLIYKRLQYFWINSVSIFSHASVSRTYPYKLVVWFVHKSHFRISNLWSPLNFPLLLHYFCTTSALLLHYFCTTEEVMRKVVEVMRKIVEVMRRITEVKGERWKVNRWKVESCDDTSWLWWWSNASWLWWWSNASWLRWWSNRLYSS